MVSNVLTCGVAAALGLAGVQGLLADEIVVGNLERGVIAVEGEQPLVPTRVSEEPLAQTLEKLGGGTLEIPFGNVLQSAAFKIGVREGLLRLSDNGGTPLAVAEPPAALQKAALWLEADANVDVQDGSVRTWYDKRETKTGDAWSANYYCANARLGWDGAPYPVLATVGGQTMLNFNGKQSGSYMRFADTTRAEIGDITGITQVFVVLDVVDSWGFPLGNTSSLAYFHPGQYNGGLDATSFYLSRSSAVPSTLGGRFFLDGASFDPVTTLVKTGRQVFAWQGVKDTTVAVGALFGDRGMWNSTYKRCGGNCIGAVVAFTNQLTVAERTSVEAYLLGKWKGTVLPAGAAVSVASGATVEVSAGSGVSFAGDKSVSVAGSGLVKTAGSGLVRLRAACGQGVPAAVEIGTGSALVSDLGELPVKLGDGDVVTRTSATPNQQTFGRTSGASGAAALVGGGIVRPADVASTVTSLTAEVDELVIGAPEAESEALANADVIEATIPDPSFEATYSNGGPAESTQNGWTFKGYTSGSTGYYYVYKLAGKSSDWAVEHNYPAPDGEQVLLLKANAEFWCTVHVPTGGVYELTFWTCKRGDANPKPLDITLERDGKVSKLGRCWPMSNLGFEQQRYRTDWLEPGDYTLRFSHLVAEDCLHHIDDIHLRLVPEMRRRRYAVPNGRFEAASFAVQSQPWYLKHLFSKSNTLDGWTLTQSAAATTDPSVAPVSRYTDGRYRFGLADNGNCHLMFCHSGGVATSPEFTVPAGTWRLRLRAAQWQATNNSVYNWNDKQLNKIPSLTVTLSNNGETVLSQTFNVQAAVLQEGACAQVVKVAEGDRLQLSLTQTADLAGLLVDDLELEECAAEDELLTNTSFEYNFNGWTVVTHNDASVEMLKKANAGRVDVSNTDNQNWYGPDRADGNVMLMLDQCGEVSQQVTFAEPGVYRFAGWFRTRNHTGSTSYGGNRLWAYLVDDQNRTNDIVKTEQMMSKVFQHHSYLFRITTAGTYTFVMRGMNGLPQPDGSYLNVVPAGCSTTDSHVIVDDVSVRKATAAELAVGYSLEQAELTLGSATKLRLDFDGTMKVDRLKLGGKRCFGVVDASHPSGLVSGPGKLEVARHGMFLIVR